MAQSQLTPQEIAAISAQFSNPPAVDDAHSEMVGRMPNVAQRMTIPPPIPMQNRPMTNHGSVPDGGFIPDRDVEDHATLPQDGVGVPSARPFNPGEVPMPHPQHGNAPYGTMDGWSYPRDEISVYEDNGQKFMIKNGCIFKQTWTTIENGSECRMFDVKRGKKVNPKSIVIQKYDWVPLSVANALATSTPRKCIAKQQVRRVVQGTPSEIAAPVVEPPKQEPPKVELPKVEPPAEPAPVMATDKKEEPVKQIKKPSKAVEKFFKPLAKPVAKPADTKEKGKKSASAKNAAHKVHNAGILTKSK